MELFPNLSIKIRNKIKRYILLPLIAIVAFLPLVTMTATKTTAANNWQVKSVDTQIISKCWNNVSQESIDKQVEMLKSLGVNYIAIGTPYDRPDEMEKWVNSIHNAGLKVWFRSHWLSWEGDEGQPKNMSANEYLTKTRQFIIDHPHFFKPGDSFTVNVEAENAGVGENKPFKDWDAYRQFLRDEIDVANSAFNQIGLNNKIQNNWLSMNGWIIENALDQQTVDKMGLITPDHYSPQGDPTSPVSVEQIASDMSKDLDRFYAKWQKPIMIGEWGYNINGEVSDALQKQAVEAVYNVFASKSYLYGVSYWDHMGNQTRIINDNGGRPTTFRPAAEVIKSHYKNTVTPPTPTNPGGNTDTTPPPTANPKSKTIADFENGLSGFEGSIVSGKNSGNALRLTNPENGSFGSKSLVDSIDLSGYNNLELDINLGGNKLLDGDASALYFEQGGWKWISLSKYVQNGKNGWQHVSIPLSDFRINTTQKSAYLGFRFWNYNSGSYDIDNIQITKIANTSTTPKANVIANFENSLSGFDSGKINPGHNSKGSLKLENPINDSVGSKKLLQGKKISDFSKIELDINLGGNKLLDGDASALYFEQGGWKWISLSKYVQNGKNGWQHVSIPLSDFTGLDRNSGLAAIGFRFWNYNSGSYLIDNIVLR